MLPARARAPASARLARRLRPARAGAWAHPATRGLGRSDFHMDRSRAIFEWVFGLPPEPHRPAPGPAAHGPGPAAGNASSPYAIDFLSVADHVTPPSLPRAFAHRRRRRHQ
jgi:hypothetical protein